MRVSRPINGQRLSSAVMRGEHAGCGDFAAPEPTRMTRADIDRSKSRNAAVSRRATLCYRLEYNETHADAQLAGR
jgi:hypothetical protein